MSRSCTSGLGLNIFKASSQPAFEHESKCFFVDVIDEIINEALPTIMSNDPLGACVSYRDLRLFAIGNTIDEMDSNLGFTPHLESSSWVSTYEPISPLASSPKYLLLCPHLN